MCCCVELEILQYQRSDISFDPPLQNGVKSEPEEKLGRTLGRKADDLLVQKMRTEQKCFEARRVGPKALSWTAFSNFFLNF